MKTLLKVVMWILTICLTIAFCAAGLPKVTGSDIWVRMFANWGYPNWLVCVIGILEVGGAVLLLHSKTILYGSSILAAVMVGAGYTLVAAREGYAVMRPAVFIVLLGIVTWQRRRSEG